MKNADLLFVFGALLLSGCASDTFVEKPTARKKSATKLPEQEEQAFLGYADGRHNAIYQPTPVTDNADREQPALSSQPFITYPELRQWPELDAELRRELDPRAGLYKIDLGEQMLSLQMLNERLLLVEATREVKEAIGYYARKLIKNKTSQWRILTNSLLALDGTWSDEELRAAVAYVAGNVPGYVEEQKKFRLSSQEKLERFEARQTESQQIERGIQLMTINIGVKDRNIREAEQALRDLEKLSVWAAR